MTFQELEAALARSLDLLRQATREAAPTPERKAA